MNMLNVAIFPNFQKKNALPCARQVCERLHRLGAQVYVDESYAPEFAEQDYVHYGVFSSLVYEMDIVIAIGGDGTILRCAKQMISSRALLLGINTGYLGFMASLEANELDELARLVKGDYQISRRMLLKGELYGEGKKTCFTALNDIAVSAMIGKVFEFSVYADEMLVGRYRADGMVCSTPTGSTAYALSAGGPIMEPELSCIEIALICPHSLFNRPLLLSSERKISIRHTANCERTIFLSADGEPPVAFPPNYRLDIERSKYEISLVQFRNNGFYDAVNHKLTQSIKGFPEHLSTEERT